MKIHPSGQTLFYYYFFHIEGLTLGACEEVHEVAGGASAIGTDRRGEVGQRKVGEVYGKGLTFFPWNTHIRTLLFKKIINPLSHNYLEDILYH